MARNLYFIAVLPPEKLRSRVEALKLEVKRLYGAGHALKSPAHITLQMPFRREEDGEEALCVLLEEYAATQTPFEVELDGFDCFAPRVVFLKIRDHSPLLPLQDHLRKALVHSGTIPDRGPVYPFHPHMTIATRDLSREAFQRTWPEFRDRPFKAAFEVGSLFLLKHNGRHWDIFREFGFSGD